MREMKDSMERWIGEIPFSWIVLRGKAILTLLERPVRDDDGIITCFRDGEVTLRSKRREDGFTMSDKEIGYQGIEPGDLVVHGMDGFAGSIGISDSRGKATPVLNVMDSTQNKKYLMYFLRTMAYNGVFLSLSTGIRVRSCDTNWNKLKTIMCLVPPLSEQQRIADFLDRKCADIDNVLVKTKASIEEYKKLKQSVITKAVTKGIRGERPMKDSGIEWIGEIPEEWTVIKFGYCAHIKSNLVDPSLYPDYPQIAPDVIGKGNAKIEGEITSVKESGIISWNHLFSKGQIIYSKIRPLLNKLIIAPFDGLCSADMYPIESDLDISFTKYMMLSSYFLEQVKQVTEDRVKMPKVNQEELSAFKVVIPPCKSEQVAIASYLDQKCSEIDSLIASKEKFITELELYKKSLIYEYVTGKKEVPSNA